MSAAEEPVPIQSQIALVEASIIAIQDHIEINRKRKRPDTLDALREDKIRVLRGVRRTLVRVRDQERVCA